MLSFLLLSAIIASFLVIGLLVTRAGAILLIVMILAVVWIIVKGYRDWKLKQEPQREEVKPAPPQQDLEPVVARARSAEKTRTLASNLSPLCSSFEFAG